MRIREVISNGFAFLGFAACLVLSALNAWIVWQALATGTTTGKGGAVYLRADGDFQFYFTVAIHAVLGVMALGLFVVVVSILVREKYRK